MNKCTKRLWEPLEFSVSGRAMLFSETFRRRDARETIGRLIVGRNPKVVAPFMKREVVVHLKAMFGKSERLAQ